MTGRLAELEHARAFSGTDFIDVPSLNAHVSDLILSRAARVRGKAERVPASSLLVLGPAGTGKTHLFERIRRNAGPTATFVHLRPEIGVEASLRAVLAALVDALRQRVATSDDAQLDIVVGSALAMVEGRGVQFPSAFLAEARVWPADRLEAVVFEAIERFEAEDPGIDGTWLEQFLFLPFLDPAKRRAALTWLSAREPSEVELKRLGRTERLSETTLKPALRALAAVASRAAPLVVVFDQLENLVDAGEGRELVHAYARVYSELHDEIARLVLVQMALEGEWIANVGPSLGQSERARLESHVERVALPTPDERELLARSWMKRLDDDERGGPFPAPLAVADWGQLRQTPGVTPRMLLHAIRRAAEGAALDLRELLPAATSVRLPSGASTDGAARDVDVEVERTTALERAWAEHLEGAHAELDRHLEEGRGLDEDRFAAAMRVVIEMVPSTRVTTVGSGERHDLRFVRGTEQFFVYAAQWQHPRALAADIDHAERATARARVLFVRERALVIPPTWKKVNEGIDRLRRLPTARVVDAPREEVARALALHDLVRAARSGDLVDDAGRPLREVEVRTFVRAALAPTEWLFAFSSGEVDTEDSGTFEFRSPPEPPAERVTADGRPVALTVLDELVLASVERVVAESARRAPGTTRNRVMAELRSGATAGVVRWFGRTVVYLLESAPEAS